MLLSLCQSLCARIASVLLREFPNEDTKEKGIEDEEHGLYTCVESANFGHYICNRIKTNVNHNNRLSLKNTHCEILRKRVKVIAFSCDVIVIPLQYPCIFQCKVFWIQIKRLVVSFCILE